MGIIAWIILGLVAGLIARAVLPGHDAVGLFATLVVGVLGALLGGFIAELVGWAGLGSFFDLRTWIIAVAGSIVLLLVLRAVSGGSPSRSRTTY